MAGLEGSGYTGKVIYRTASQGHTNCVNATSPIASTSTSETGDGAVGNRTRPSPNDLAFYEEYENELYTRFRWGEIPKYNEVRMIFRQSTFRSSVEVGAEFVGWRV